MSKLGGFSPLPMRLGGGQTRVETLYKSLNESLGTAYDVSDESNVTAETMAEARALDAVWSSNRRMSLQWDPRRMTDFLSRWEKIFAVAPSPGDSDNARRAVLQGKFLALIGPSTLEDVVMPIASASFVGIEYTELVDAVPKWPGNSFPDEWHSNVAHIVIRVKFTANQTLAEFWRMKSKLTAFLNDYLPAWVTFDIAIFRESTGLSGFYLDERNLDFETFLP